MSKPLKAAIIVGLIVFTAGMITVGAGATAGALTFTAAAGIQKA